MGADGCRPFGHPNADGNLGQYDRIHSVNVMHLDSPPLHGAPPAPRVLDVFFVADRSFPRACFLLVQILTSPARSQTDIDPLGLQDDRMTLSTIGISCTEYRFVPRTAKRRFGRTRACSGPCRGSSISNSFRSQRSASLQKSKNRVSPPLSPSHPRQSAPWVLACSTVRPTPLTALASL